MEKLIKISDNYSVDLSKAKEIALTIISTSSTLQYNREKWHSLNKMKLPRKLKKKWKKILSMVIEDQLIFRQHTSSYILAETGIMIIKPE